MKTKLIIEFETKDMNEIKDSIEEGAEIVTDIIEYELHESFKKYLKDIVNNDNEDFETYMVEYASVEGFESLKDFGNIQIRIIEDAKDESQR